MGGSNTGSNKTTGFLFFCSESLKINRGIDPDNL
jgi:hypothetical protein